MTPLQKALFLLGQVGMMGLARFFFQWILQFAATENPSEPSTTMMSAGAVGALLLAFRVFDGVTDPVVGALSDWWARRGGKKKTLLLWALILPSIGLVLCFTPTFEMSLTMRWMFLVAGMFLFFIGYTFYAIPYWSLIDDYSCGDDDERRRLSNLLGVGLLIATGIGFVISPLLVESLGYFGGASIFGALALAGMVAPYFAEPACAREQTVSPVEQSEGIREILQSFLSALRHREFLCVILLIGGSQMSLTVMTSAAPFVARGLLGRSESDVALLLGPLLGMAFPLFPFAPKLSRRFGWERTLLVSAVLLGVVYCLCSLVGNAIIGSAFTTAMILFALGGPMVALLLALEGEAITDCAHRAGGGSVSMYFGVYNLAVKGLNGLAIFIAGVLADLSTRADGAWAIRAMVIVAGSMLFAGVIGYWLLKRSPRGAVAPSTI